MDVLGEHQKPAFCHSLPQLCPIAAEKEKLSLLYRTAQNKSMEGLDRFCREGGSLGSQGSAYRHRAKGWELG